MSKAFNSWAKKKKKKKPSAIDAALFKPQCKQGEAITGYNELNQV